MLFFKKTYENIGIFLNILLNLYIKNLIFSI